MFTGVTDFVDVLSHTGLLEPAQLDALASFQHDFPELPDLIRELQRRRWLTKYQVECLKIGGTVPLVLGPYVLLDELGKGGMGCVYKARHRQLERIVALKVINPTELDHPDAIRRLQREAKAVARLKHPNIVMLYDAAEIDGLHFLALEYVRGVDLDRLLVANGPFDIGMACDCIRQAALGLQHAYERGLVHRDIKPSNLLLTTAPAEEPSESGVWVDSNIEGRAGVVKILDLGLARFSNRLRLEEGAEKLSVDGVVVGTPDYLAPEQALDSSRVDIRADIYSLGCSFYELLSGQTPFADRDGTQKLIGHIQDEPKPLESLRAGLPLELVAVVRKMMAKKVEERFQQPAQVAECLTDLADQLGQTGGAGRPDAHRPLETSHDTRANVTDMVRFRTPRGGPDPASGLYARHPRELAEHRGPVNCAAFAPDGCRALTGGEDQALCLWDTDACRKLRRLPGHTGAVLCVAFAPDGRRAVSAGRDRAVLLWDVEAGKQAARLKGVACEVSALAYAPDGRTILTGGADGTLALWDARQQRLVRSLGGLVRGRHFDAVTALLLTPDNARAISAGADGTVRLWNVNTGQELHRFTGHTGAVRCVALSEDGLHLLTGGADGVVRYWGMLSGTELGRFAGHTSEVRGVAFAADGRSAVSADTKAWCVWDLATGGESLRLREGNQTIRCLAVSPGGRQILTGGADRFLCLWKRNE